ncbi:MAG TPA: YihY/virulence factor BrkB family protein [Acidimicrobiales bacterium]|nr:YihY/virulence factor BrkB family protein [Acidimicrobiales bacterium]
MFDLERWRARFRWLDAALRVNERFAAVGGGPLAASIGLAGFLSLFPLLLVAIAVVGFLSSGRADFADDVVASLDLDGRTAEVVRDVLAAAEGSRRTASIVGVLGLLWSGLGVVGSLQQACNAVWQTVGRGLVDRAVALAWLVGAGLLFVATTALGPLAGMVPGPAVIPVVAGGLVISTVLFTWTYTFLGNQSVPARAHLPGAALVAVGVEVLKLIGGVWVPRAVASSSALYGSLGVVFAVLAWLLLYARLFVYGAVVNVLRWEAEAGTVTVDVQVPRMAGGVPVEANRGGAVVERPPASAGDG